MRASPSCTDRWAVCWGPPWGRWEWGPRWPLSLGLQVRRMTAILVAVGLGAVTPTQVKRILQSRDPLGRHQTRVAPAHGLFLKSVLFGGLQDLGKRCLGSPCLCPLTGPAPGWVLWEAEPVLPQPSSHSSSWESRLCPAGEPRTRGQGGSGFARRLQAGDQWPKGRRPGVRCPCPLEPEPPQPPTPESPVREGG